MMKACGRLKSVYWFGCDADIPAAFVSSGNLALQRQALRFATPRPWAAANGMFVFIVFIFCSFGVIIWPLNFICIYLQNSWLVKTIQRISAIESCRITNLAHGKFRTKIV